MKKYHRSPTTIRLAAVAPASLACALTAAAARGAPSCEGPEILADDHVSPRWAQAINTLKAELRALPDVDRCGRVVLFGAGEDVVVDVALRDGRSTVRRVTRPEMLPAVVGSLILLPPGEAQPAGSSSASAAPSSPPPPALPPPASSPQPTKQPPPSPARTLDFEVGLGASGRISAEPTYGTLGASAFAQLALDRLLFGVAFRASALEKLVVDNPPGFYAQSTGLAAEIGVRVGAGPLALDVMAGPELVIEELDRDFDGQEGAYASANDFRAAASVRAYPSPLRSFRPFLQLDADASPRRLLGGNRRPHHELPRLPVATLGLSVGIAGVLF